MRSVALLLAQMEPCANADKAAERLVGQMLDKFTETVEAVTQAAVAEVKSASSALTVSSMLVLGKFGPGPIGTRSGPD